MIENSAGWRYVQSADSVADYPTVSEHNAGKFQEVKSIVDGKAPLTHTHPQSQVTGLDTALAGKAPVSHTHTQSQVTGLDTALAGKAPLSTLNTRVPENLALRLDTTVGTRIFSGAHMIYGDTGWRDITTSAGSAVSMVPGGKINIRRVGHMVYYKISGMKATSTYGNAMTTHIGFLTAATQVSADISTNQPAGARWQVSRYQVAYMGAAADKMLASENEEIIIQVVTDNSWPTTLPGTPA